jgi:hypothetical protein
LANDPGCFLEVFCVAAFSTKSKQVGRSKSTGRPDHRDTVTNLEGVWLLAAREASHRVFYAN